jgi:hypothetical protein
LVKITVTFYVAVQKRPLDLAILVDTSARITSSQWTRVLNFVNTIVDGFDVSQQGTHVSLIPFGSTASATLSFNTIRLWNKPVVKTYVDAIKQSPGVRRVDLALYHAESRVFQTFAGMRPQAIKVKKT